MSNNLRTQLWILALAQALDLAFSDRSGDPLSGPDRERLADSLDRVAEPSGGGGQMAEEVASSLLALGISQSALGKIVASVQSLMGNQGWRRAGELLTLEASSITAGIAALTSSLYEPILPRKDSRFYRWAAQKALGILPGATAIGEVLRMDGTLLHYEPLRQLRISPWLAKEALSLAPAPLAAGALVGSAFAKGISVQQLWAQATGQSARQPASRLKRVAHHILVPLGLQAQDGSEVEVPEKKAQLEAVSIARWARAALSLG